MKLLQAFLLLFMCTTANAQKKLPQFGKIDASDLKMTECEFDKGAPAVKLIDYGTVDYQRGIPGHSYFKTVYKKRSRIKILTDKGLSYANVEIPYYNRNNEEKIVDVDAIVYNLDDAGKVSSTKVTKGSMYNKKINKHYSRHIIAFPNVKVGSVIEYRYTIESVFETYLKEWYFQDEIPTAYSEYNLEIPSLLKFDHQPLITGKHELYVDNSETVIDFQDGPVKFATVQTKYIVRDLPGITYEPFTSAPKDYKQRVAFKLAKIDMGREEVENVNTSWKDVVKRFDKDEDFGEKLKRQFNSADSIVLNAKNLATEQEKIRYIFNAVRNHMTSTDDENIWLSETLEDSWKSKQGNSADINMILVSLLNKANIPATPILLSTRDHGLVVTDFPDHNHFNVLMAYVHKQGGFLVLDATDRISDYRLTPERIVNTVGLLMGDKASIVEVVNNNHKHRMQISIEGKILPDGKIEGETNILSYDYARRKKVASIKTDPEAYRKRFNETGAEITEYAVKDLDKDSVALNEKIVFTSNLTQADEFSFFTTNYFSGFSSNPFTNDLRKTDIDFGTQQEYVIYVNFTLPEGYVFDEVPKDASFSMPMSKANFKRVMEAKNNVLNGRITVNFNSTYYPLNDYPVFQTFYKKIIESLNEQVVIKKKA